MRTSIVYLVVLVILLGVIFLLFSVSMGSLDTSSWPTKVKEDYLSGSVLMVAIVFAIGVISTIKKGEEE